MRTTVAGAGAVLKPASVRHPLRAIGVAATAFTLGSAGACELVLLEPRTERELMRLAMAEPVLALSFVHSVLGTAVHDHYRWRAGQWRLVQERFHGEGYGLPYAAQAGERLTRDASGQWTLHTDRVVDPLTVRPVAQMQLEVPGRAPLRLDALPGAGAAGRPNAIELRAIGCKAAP